MNLIVKEHLINVLVSDSMAELKPPCLTNFFLNPMYLIGQLAQIHLAQLPILQLRHQ